MAEIIRLPSDLRVTARGEPFLEQFTLSGGVAINGYEQTVSPLTERWRWRFSVLINNARSAHAYRAFLSRMRGRGNYAEVRICDPYRITRQMIGATYSRASVPHKPVTEEEGGGGGGGSAAWGDSWGDAWGDAWGAGVGGPPPTPSVSTGAYFSDGSGYALAEPKSPLTDDAPLNATSISFEAGPLAGHMSVGLFISLGGWPHLIEGWSQNGNIITAQINPPLRRARPTGYDVEFDAKFVGKFVSDDTGEIGTLAGGKYGLVPVSLVEDIGRAD
jgi:hypothetical protein